MKKLGILDYQENESIRLIFYRKKALEELFASSKRIKEDGELFERIIQEMAKSKYEMERWWLDISQKYSWSLDNFETSEIFLDKAINMDS
jgi:CXXX repeat modification system protein